METKRWVHPRNYMGQSWKEWYVSFTQTRDSGTLERSNFAVAYKHLKEFETELPDGEPSVQIVREGHWAVGWVEWIAIHESNTLAIAESDKLFAEYDSYACLDEMHWSELEWKVASEYWEAESIKERLYWLKRYTKAPCFAARHSLSELCDKYDSGDLISQLAE